MAQIIKISPLESRLMLEFQKEILKKVSFDQNLFEKELQKSEKWLLIADLKLLVEWAIANFGKVFVDLEAKIRKFFAYLFGEHSSVSVNI